MELPEDFDAGIAAEGAVAGHDGEVFGEGGGEDRSVERIAMMWRQSEHLERVILLKREQLDFQIGERPLDVGG